MPHIEGASRAAVPPPPRGFGPPPPPPPPSPPPPSPPPNPRALRESLECSRECLGRASEGPQKGLGGVSQSLPRPLAAGMRRRGGTRRQAARAPESPSPLCPTLRRGVRRDRAERLRLVLRELEQPVPRERKLTSPRANSETRWDFGRCGTAPPMRPTSPGSRYGEIGGDRGRFVLSPRPARCLV